jgi:hypothetical protein
MLDIKNQVISNLSTVPARNRRFIEMKNQMDTKAAAYLRYLGTKNAMNRAADYHYLMLGVQNSTAPVNGIDYIHPTVAPAVDYVTAVVTKGLCPNGEILFEFVPENDDDSAAARQATDMVSKMVNEYNDPHAILHRWIKDAALHKNGMMMIKPVRELVTRYVTTQGTPDQLQAYERKAEDSGLKIMRQSRRKISIDIERAAQESQQYHGQKNQADGEQIIQDFIDNLQAGVSEEQQVVEDQILHQANVSGDVIPDTEQVDDQQRAMQDIINRSTVYEVKYKLTGYNINIQFHPIAQHYWICDPTVEQIKDQPFCGFYDPMSIAEAYELYPDIKLEEFMEFAEYNQSGAYQAGSVLNNLAIHARDSVPIQGIPVNSASTSDPYGRQVTILTIWTRYDIDGDGELELCEIIYSGSYIISAREVEFIPVANMCPKPLPGNFYGFSIAERVIPIQEYSTSIARSELLLGLLTATPRMGVKPDRLDFEMLQDGDAAIFVLDSKFDPATDVYQVPPPGGNLGFAENAMARLQEDAMALVGMTQPQDVFNPEIMAPGNSGIKLQMALTPNQIIQDDTIKNCAEGLKSAIWLVWRTLVQYGDDYGVRKLAGLYHDDRETTFLDYVRFDEEMDFYDRKLINLELAMGMNSEENRIAKQQIIQGAQQQLYALVAQMTQQGTLTPEIYAKVKRPFADTLYALGVKDCDTYLPTDEETLKMIEQGQEAAKNRQPSPEEEQKTSQAELNRAKVEEIRENLTGESAERRLEIATLLEGKPKAYG